jgi:GH15 family glucan-1,4-alpha-glucosidase
VARIVPRFDYGEVRPWVRRRGTNVAAAIGGDCGLLISATSDLACQEHDMASEFTVEAGGQVAFSVSWFRPEEIDGDRDIQPPSTAENSARLEATLQWWGHWSARAKLEGPDADAVIRSALVLRGLVNAPTGAVAAAPTTSLPEEVGGERNWDYRFSWIRDSSFSVRSLAEIGFDREADGFRRFMQRSAAGSAHDLQIMYGLGGERRLEESQLTHLEGYRRSRPVRIGNGASKQLQLDAYGQLVLLSWRWHLRGQAPDDDYWRFLLDLVDTAAERWEEPDCGIWEIRGKPIHFVYSKANCWAALDRGIALAQDCMRKAPVARWRRTAKAIREAIEDRGYDRQRGVFRQAFDKPDMDAGLLLLPATGFVDWLDERMVQTVAAIREELMSDGLLLRYRPELTDDGLRGREGTFLPCSFWLAEGLARQGQGEAAREVFDRAASTSSDLGLFAEEFDTRHDLMLGNFPQGLTHLSHIAAAMALAEINHPPTGR